MLITFFSFVMGIYGNLVLGPSVEQWRTFGESMRNLVPMLRRPDAFDWEAAQAVDDTALAVYAPARTPPRPRRHCTVPSRRKAFHRRRPCRRSRWLCRDFRNQPSECRLRNDKRDSLRPRPVPRPPRKDCHRKR